jgi:hypothetical protein
MIELVRVLAGRAGLSERKWRKLLRVAYAKVAEFQRAGSCTSTQSCASTAPRTAVLVGENNAGKSNVVDALRSVLEPEIGPRGREWLSPDDFAHDGHGNPTSSSRAAALA